MLPRQGLQVPVGGRLPDPPSRLEARRPRLHRPVHAHASGHHEAPSPRRQRRRASRAYNHQFAIDQLQPGDVFVADMFGKKNDGPIVGDNLFYYIMKATGSAGLVVDGSVRDLEGLVEIRCRPTSATLTDTDPRRDAHGHQRPDPDRRRHGHPRRPRLRRPRGRLLRAAVPGPEQSSTRPTSPTSTTSGRREVRGRQVQVERDLRLPDRPGPEEGVRGLPAKRLAEIKAKR